MRGNYYCFFLLALSFLLSVSADLLSPTQIPNPMKDPKACGRGTVPRSAICDPDNLLLDQEKNSIDHLINQQGPNVEIAILIIEKMKDLHSGSSKEDSKLYAVETHNAWGVGDKTRNDGVLIFLSIRDRSAYISVGRGVKSQLTSPVILKLIGIMKPFLRGEKYALALEQVVIEIDFLITGKDSKLSKFSQGIGHTITNYLFDEDPIFLMFIAMLFFILISSCYMYMFELIFPIKPLSQQLNEGSKALDKLMREVEEEEIKLRSDSRKSPLSQDGSQSQSSCFFSRSCPVCLLDYPPKPSYPPSSPPSSFSSSFQSSFFSSLTKKRFNHHSLSPSKENAKHSEKPTSESDSDEKNAVQQYKERQPMSLRCGHVFCKRCLLSLLYKGYSSWPSLLSRFCPSSSSSFSLSSSFSFSSSSDSLPLSLIDPHAKCPICRLQLTRDTSPSPSSQHTQNPSSPYSYSYSPSLEDPIMSSDLSLFSTLTVTSSPEYRFRVHQLHHIHPEVFTQDTVHSLSQVCSLSDWRTQSSLCQSQVSVRYQREVQAEIDRAAASQTSTSTSTSGSWSGGSSNYDFGGGGSDGGGGGGDSW